MAAWDQAWDELKSMPLTEESRAIYEEVVSAFPTKVRWRNEAHSARMQGRRGGAVKRTGREAAGGTRRGARWRALCVEALLRGGFRLGAL